MHLLVYEIINQYTNSFHSFSFMYIALLMMHFVLV